MKYSLNAGEWNSVFAVPTSVVDRYIKLAGAGALKLLLFLMRHGGESFSDDELKDALGFRREGELEDAALFWVQRGIIKADSTSLSAAADEIPVQQTLPEMDDEPKKQSTSVRAVNDSSAAIYTASDIAGRINTDKAISYLFSEAQALYGRLLKQPESRTILMLVDHYGLPAEVAAMLLKYCFKIGKTSMGYIQTVAQTWSDDGIRTAAEADALLAKLEHRFAAEEKLRNAMHLTTKFSPKQQSFIKVWTEDWEFSVDMIMHAYDITLDNTGGMNFSYTNKVLENWHSAGIRTKEAAEEEAKAHKNGRKKPEADSKSSINVDDVMLDVLNKYRS
ncbi:MAG: DnaD domain protein [Oscillospiraceae bacterium]|nr:DnaD domain protein [Oscillospiraceae bacterium]